MKPLSVFKLNIFIMFFLNIIGAYYSGLRNSCSIFRACFVILQEISSSLQYCLQSSVKDQDKGL